MGVWRVTLDRAGVGNLLKEGDIPDMTNEAAERIASEVRNRLPRDGDGDVVVEPYVTDRGAAAVVARHPQALGLQAKYGILTASAAVLGIPVKGARLRHVKAEAARRDRRK